MPIGDDTPAEISVADARLLAQALSDIAALKAAVGIGRGPGANDGRPQLNAPRAWIRIIGNSDLPGFPPNRWKYFANVLPHPFAYLLDPVPPNLSGAVPAFNALEVANTADYVWGEAIEASGCGYVRSVKAITESYPNYPVEAELRWTWLESGDPTVGYYAYWFSLPNMVEIGGPS